MSGSGLMERIIDLGNSIFGQPAADGALPSLYAATAPGVSGGQYFGPDGFLAMRGSPKPVSFVKAARDPAAARRLWEVSEELTGVRYAPSTPRGEHGPTRPVRPPTSRGCAPRRPSPGR